MRFKVPIRLLPIVVATMLAASDACVTVAVAQDEPAETESGIRFHFRGASFDQVIDFFSRVTGLPVVRETDVPDGTLDYWSPERYELPEALRVLNIILQAKGVMLRVEEDMLYLQKLTEMQRENVPTFVGRLPAEVTPDQIVTVVRALEVTAAATLAEPLSKMVAEYGSVAALESQNALVITETAAQIRRLLRIVEELDREAPEDATELFPIRSARAADLMKPLTALLSKRVERLVLDQKGNQQKIEVEEMPGLSISYDDRTNSIIAKGVQKRIDKLREVIAWLDVPATNGGGRSIRTVALTTVGPQQAADRLTQLFGSLPEGERPTVIALEDLGKVTMVGADTALADGLALLQEMDGQAETLNDPTRNMATIPLEHARPAPIIELLNTLLNHRQRATTRLAAGPHGGAIVAVGAEADLQTVRAVVDAFDAPERVDRRARIVRLDAPRPAALLAEAKRLYTAETAGDDATAEVVVELDEASGLATLIGAEPALDRFMTVLRMVDANRVIKRETRRFELANARPAEMIETLRATARSLLAPRDGRAYDEPRFDAVEELDLIIVTAVPEQFAVLSSLITAVDRSGPSAYAFRIVGIEGVDDVPALLQRAGDAFELLRRGHDTEDVPLPETRLDEASGKLVISGLNDAVGLYEQALAQARQLMPPPRRGELYSINQVQAADVVAPLQELFEQTRGGPAARDVPPPVIQLIERTNSLYIVAEPAQHDMVGRYLQQLDRYEPDALPPLRLIQVRAADADKIARLLEMRYEARPSERRREQPVEIGADPGTNTLIVMAHEAVFPEIRQFIDDLNSADDETADRETMLFTLQRARAADLAAALDKLYPEPPMPRDRRGRELPHMQKPRELQVTADAATNTLIIEAPRARRDALEALVEQLDRIEMPEQATMRTYRLTRSDAEQVARTLEDLAGRGLLSAVPQDGSQPVPVTIRIEPRSGTLIVAGDETTFARTEELLAELEATPAARDVRVFTVRGDAQAISERALRLYDEQMAELPDAPDVDVEVDRSRGAIVAVAEAEALDRFAAALEAVEAIAGVPADVRLIRLEHIEPSQAIDFVHDMLDREASPVPGPEPLLQTVPRTNSVLVAAAGEQHATIASLIEAIDTPVDTVLPPLRIMPLRTADASQLAQALSARYDRRSIEQQRQQPVDIAADPSTNALLISAAGAVLDEIQAIVDELNATDSGDVEPRELRVFPLKRARAESVAPILQSLLQSEQMPIWMRYDIGRRNGQEPDLGPDVRVSAEPRLNAVVIAAPVHVLRYVEPMIEQLDIDPDAASGGRAVHVLRIDNADATALATNLEALFAGPDQSETPPTIRVDAASNSLIIRATAEQHAIVQGVVAQVDRATIAASRQMRTVPIDPARASASDVARTLQKLLDQDGGAQVEVITLEELIERHAPPATDDQELPGDSSSALPIRRGEPSLNHAAAPWQICVLACIGLADEPADITIAVDPDTNSLVIVGTPRSTERVLQLVAEIQEQLPVEGGTLRYVSLPQSIDSRSLARLVVSTLRQMTPPGGNRGDYLQRAAVLADPSANALAIVATDHDFETIGQIVAAMSDPPAARQVVVKIYPLETITVERARDSVDALLQPVQRRGRGGEEARTMAVKLLAEGQTIEAVFSPRDVSIASDPQSNALIVMAPQPALDFLDRFIEQIDEKPVNVQSTLKLYPLEHARAGELQGTLRRIFRNRFRSMERRQGGSTIEPDIAADQRSNTLLVTASPETLHEIDSLLAQLDQAMGEELHPLEIIELKAAQPERVRDLLEQIVIGDDQDRRRATSLVADNNSGLLMVRASEEVRAEITALLSELDRDATRQFPVRTITLERADAESVADALQRFFDDRARIASSGRGRRDQSRRVSIIGDPTSSTLLIAASDEDFAQIETLVEQFDTPQAAGALTYRVFPLRHAKARELQDTVQRLVDDLNWNQGPSIWWWGGGGDDNSDRDKVAVRADDRLNVLIVTGTGDKFDVVESLIAVLDAPTGDEEQKFVRIYRAPTVDVNVLGDMLTEVYTDVNRRWWEPPDPTEPRIRVDRRSSALVIAATARQHDEIESLLASLAAQDQGAIADQGTEVIPIEYARAEELARTLRRFFIDRAAATNQPAPTTTFAASDSANSLVVSAIDADLVLIRDLIERLDQPDVTGDRVIEIVALTDGDAEQITAMLREQFGRRSGQNVIVTSDLRTNSIIINAPKDQYAQALALIERLDAPSASDETVVRIYNLQGATAGEVEDLLQQVLQLDARGQTEGITVKLDELEGQAVEVRAKIVADRRSNSLIVTATEKSFPVIEALIRQVDQVPAVSPQEWRIIPLEHAKAPDVVITLNAFFRDMTDGDQPRARIDYNRFENNLIVAATPDQFEQLQKILVEIDVPSTRPRITEFVPLRFAEAAKVAEALDFFYGWAAPGAETPGAENVVIVADPATNSLVISAEEAEWPPLRAILAELDSEEYDSSLQLRVIPLLYADAASVADAINNAFQGTLERNQRQRRPEMQGRNRDREENDDRGGDFPSMLVETQEWVRASAEPQTNSLIITASRQNVAKIERIIEQLDVADYARLPPPRLIAVGSGDPVQLADSLRTLFEQQTGSDRTRAIRIVGDRTSSTIIVRADEEDYRQIETLAAALQQEAADHGVTVSVIRLQAAPARRVAEAIRAAYSTKAMEQNHPLSIDVDVAGNSMIVASTASMLQEIERTVADLDALAPGRGQGIFIIELENVSPDTAASVVETIGLTRAQNDDSSRIVSEPIRISLLPGRNAIVVVANPADRDTVVGLLKAIDAAPELGENQLRVFTLSNARAEAVANLLRQVLDQGNQQATTPLARAVAEQVRRLALRRDGLDEPDLTLDLTTPIRIIADVPLNAVLISATESNIIVLEQIIAMFDTVPVTDAVTVQIYPLQNIAATDFARIVTDMFQQGKALGSVPGSDVTALPGGMVGRALFDDIALAVDERTNTVIVAGKEEPVALVEVLSKRLDSDVTNGWVEPRLVRLVHADAETLADLLRAVLVEGSRDLPQSSPLQRQVARLRLARADDNGGEVLEADVFQPMNRLFIRAEPQLNALVLVGTPMNLEVVTELVTMFDVEAASPSAVVRIYPVEHASASRLAETITNLFEQQVQSKAIRPEDRAIVQADERSNALIVTTSHRSFAVLERLLEMLDTVIAPDLREIRRIPLENASAVRVARLVQELMDARLERLRRVQPETADLERATIIADPRTNSLVIAAGNESFEVVQRLAADLDDGTLADTSLIDVIFVETASLDALATTINQLMERRYADVPDDVGRSQRPLVLTDARTRSLLVAANPEDMTAIRGLVEKLAEAPAHPAVSLHVVPLTSGRADDIAPRIQRLMREREQSLGDSSSPSDRVAVESDAAANSLIVAANDENLQIIMDLIETLTSAGLDSIAGGAIEIIQLRGSLARDVAEQLEDLYADEENRQRGAGTIRITPDDRLNALLVTAPEADMRIIKSLVSQLDGARPSTVVEIKYIPLTSANALETVSLVENVLAGRGLGPRRRTQQATVLKYLRQIDGAVDETEMEVSAAIRESITLTPDVRTNTIIVSAPRESIGMIERMIQDLDNSSVGSQSIRIFKLVNADANAMADILRELFNLQRQGNLYVLKPRESAIGPELEDDALANLFGSDLTAVPDERQQLSITVDSRTNSLLVSGTPTYLDLVGQVVEELDAQEANERSVFVYPLLNATAEDVARVVRDFVDTEQQKLLSTLGTEQIGAAARLLEREVTIVDDTKTNSVLVSVSPRYEDRLRQIIEGLDVDPPQVLIQVLLAEVTIDGSFEWGVDLDFETGIGSGTLAGGYGLASAFVSGMGVPNISLTSSDFRLVIRALESQGRLQVLSNPSVMAANNEEAEIQVGEEIRVPEGVSFEQGSQQSAVVERDIGIILRVTPSINPEGFVRLDVRPEISELSERTTQISEDFESPIITQRHADTTVTVRDGQTIVIGGLIEDRYERRENKVPVLGDLPLFGPLFRHELETTQKTELLIVLTPYVIESPSEIDLLTEDQIDRLSLPDELKDQIRNAMLEGRLFDADGNPLGGDPLEYEEPAEPQP